MEDKAPQPIIPLSESVAFNQAATITAQFQLVTPVLAAEWLSEKNQMNRGKRRKRLAVLTQDMEDGYFEQTGEPITFDCDGYLVNGQHRLTAVVESEESQEFLIVRGVLPRVRTAIDANSPRRFADDLQMAGETSAVTKESLIRAMVRWDKYGGLADTTWQPSRRYLASRYGIYGAEISETINATNRWRNVWEGNTVSMRFTWWLLVTRLGYDRDKVTRFMSILAIGSQDSRDDMLIRMRQKIGQPIAYTSNGGVIHMPAGVEVYWLIQAWNRWITDSRGNYMTPKNGINDPFPQPVNPLSSPEESK